MGFKIHPEFVASVSNQMHCHSVHYRFRNRNSRHLRTVDPVRFAASNLYFRIDDTIVISSDSRWTVYRLRCSHASEISRSWIGEIAGRSVVYSHVSRKESGYPSEFSASCLFGPVGRSIRTIFRGHAATEMESAAACSIWSDG